MGLFTKIFGTYSERELKLINPIVNKIVALMPMSTKRPSTPKREN